VIAWIGLGANLGRPKLQLRRAVQRMPELGVEVRRISSLYRSAPLGPRDQPEYLNAAVEAETTLQPEELLDRLKLVEREAGRVPRGRWRERELDLDLLLAADSAGWILRDTPELTLPHPGLERRAFVLLPLLEIRPGLKSPLGGTPLEERLDAKIPGRQSVIRIHEGETWCHLHTVRSP